MTVSLGLRLMAVLGPQDSTHLLKIGFAVCFKGQAAESISEEAELKIGDFCAGDLDNRRAARIGRAVGTQGESIGQTEGRS